MQRRNSKTKYQLVVSIELVKDHNCSDDSVFRLATYTHML
jgi:hypothetical protein